MLQRRGRRGGGAFDVTHYKPLKKYLVVLGQYPSQTDFMNKSIVIVMVGSMVTLVIPSVSGTFLFRYCMLPMEYPKTIRASTVNWGSIGMFLEHFAI